MMILDYDPLIKHCLQDEGFNQTDLVQLEIRWVDAKESHKLNKQFRGKDEPTDVLSFPLYSYQELKELKQQPLETPVLLGSLVLCKKIITQRALEAGRSLDDQTTWSLKHGFKHLLGQDHNEDGTLWFPVKAENRALPYELHN